MYKPAAVSLATVWSPFIFGRLVPIVTWFTFMSIRTVPFGPPSAPDAVPVRPANPLPPERLIRCIGRPWNARSIQTAMPPLAKIAFTTVPTTEVVAVEDPVLQMAILTIAQARHVVVASVALPRAVHDPNAIHM